MSLWPIRSDVSELETALLNLVINARDAMPDGGTVTIGARNVVQTEPPHAGEFVAISVTDTGIGIPADVVNKIFEPFFTTKPIGKGTGLGLSQVHGFAHQAGGTVKVASELGQGTTFTILLPREMGAPDREASGATTRGQRHRAAGRGQPGRRTGEHGPAGAARLWRCIVWPMPKRRCARSSATASTSYSQTS